jgi:peroxiredoxin
MSKLFSRRAVLASIVVSAAAAVAAAALITSNATASIQVGGPAPPFTVVDATGATRTLSEFAGKTVILEWTNKDCPFVRRQYGAHKMQDLQREATEQGVVWLSVISSAPGKQGYLTGPEALANAERVGAAPTAILLDPTGAMGHAYGATNTPHMFVINAEGRLVYQGAFDNLRTADPRTGFDGVANYVAAALADLDAGRPVETPETRAYGCSIKYAG